MLASLLLPALLAAPVEGEALPLASRITEVVVHGDTARVRRSAQVERSGVHQLTGLPGSLDPDAIRVRLQSGVGQSWFAEPVLPEQEFTLHLGADQGLKVERVKTDELHEAPGLFSKRQADTLAWRVRLSNLGATPAGADGSVDVLVREAIPRPADERIAVELGGESHRALTDERWIKDDEEKGIRTWRVPVGKGGTADVTFRVTTRCPEKTSLEAGS